jgi:hypothetical protein
LARDSYQHASPVGAIGCELVIDECIGES